MDAAFRLDALPPIDEDRVVWQSSQYPIRDLLFQLDQSAASTSTSPPHPPPIASALSNTTTTTTATSYPSALGSTASESGRPSKRPRRATRTQSQTSLSGAGFRAANAAARPSGKRTASSGSNASHRSTSTDSAARTSDKPESTDSARGAAATAPTGSTTTATTISTTRSSTRAPDLLEDMLARVMAENERKAAASQTQRRSQTQAPAPGKLLRTRERGRERSLEGKGAGVLADRTNISPSVGRSRSSSGEKEDVKPPAGPKGLPGANESLPKGKGKDEPLPQSPGRGRKRAFSDLRGPGAGAGERVAFEEDVRRSMEIGTPGARRTPASPPRTRSRVAALSGEGTPARLPMPARTTTTAAGSSAVPPASQGFAESQVVGSQGVRKRNAPLGMHAPRTGNRSLPPAFSTSGAGASTSTSTKSAAGPIRTPASGRAARVASTGSVLSKPHKPAEQGRGYKIPAFRPPAAVAPTPSPLAVHASGLPGTTSVNPLLTPARAHPGVGTVAGNTRSAARRRSSALESVQQSARSTRSERSERSARSGRSERSRRELSSCDDSFGFGLGEGDVGELEEVMRMYDA